MPPGIVFHADTNPNVALWCPSGCMVAARGNVRKPFGDTLAQRCRDLVRMSQQRVNVVSLVPWERQTTINPIATL